jgi:hypothetical protein
MMNTDSIELFRLVWSTDLPSKCDERFVKIDTVELVIDAG